MIANFSDVICEEEGAIIDQGFPGDEICNVDNCEGVANSFEGTFGVEIFSDDIFGRLVYKSEGISEVEFFTVDNKL